MERMAGVDEGLLMDSEFESYQGGDLTTTRDSYHQECPCCVVEKDRGCYDEHCHADKLVKLYRYISIVVVLMPVSPTMVGGVRRCILQRSDTTVGN